MTGGSNAFDIQSIPFRGLVEQALVGVYIIQDEIFQYANATWAAMTGHTPEQLIGQPVSRFVPPDYVSEVIARYYRRVSGAEPSMRFITRGLHRDGHIVLIDVHGTAMDFHGRPAVVGVGVDVTEQVAQHAQLQQSRRQYRELAAYLNTIRERQRAEYAREVHDVLGGLLTSMKLDVGRIQRRSEPGEIRTIADDLNALLQEAIDNVREISESLRPQALDHLGLCAAMVSHLHNFERRSGVQAQLQPPDFDIALSRTRATMVFRIFQEALTNVARHAGASEVQVKMSVGQEHFRMEVVDNGSGMQTSTEGDRMGSFGLLSMQERASELGGTLAIESAPGAGTRIVLDAPLHYTLSAAPYEREAGEQ